MQESLVALPFVEVYCSYLMGVVSKISVGSCYNYTYHCLIKSSLAEWKRQVENASANKPQLHPDLCFP